MPFSNAPLNRRTDLSSSTSPHQPVDTVQTPKPTSETRMSVPASFRYLILDPSSHSKLSRQRITTFYRHTLLTCSLFSGNLTTPPISTTPVLSSLILSPSIL